MTHSTDLPDLNFPEKLAILFGVSFFLYGLLCMGIYIKERGEIISWFFTSDIINLIFCLFPIWIAFWKETNKKTGGKANLGCWINIFVYSIFLIFLIKDFLWVIPDYNDNSLKHIVEVLIIFCGVGIAAEFYWLQRKKHGTLPP